MDFPVSIHNSAARSNFNDDCDMFHQVCILVSYLFNCCYDGEFKPLDAWDRPWQHDSKEEQMGRQRKKLVGGKRFVCWNMRGDAEWMSNALQCAHFNEDESPCI